MNRITKYLFGSVALFSMSACNNSYVQPDAPIKEVPFTQVHLDDNFWTPRIETNRTVSIPSAFKECEKVEPQSLRRGFRQSFHILDYFFIPVGTIHNKPINDKRKGNVTLIIN